MKCMGNRVVRGASRGGGEADGGEGRGPVQVRLLAHPFNRLP